MLSAFGRPPFRAIVIERILDLSPKKMVNEYEYNHFEPAFMFFCFFHVRFSELPPPQPPPFKKCSATFMNFRLKNRGVKREKIVTFFVNST